MLLKFYRWFMKRQLLLERKNESEFEPLYEAFYSSVERKSNSSLDPMILMTIIGFSAGGPVSLRSIKARNIYMTNELASYKQQCSADGLINYELITIGDFEEDLARQILTAIGAMTLSTLLGNRHTIDVSHVLDSTEPVIMKLSLYSKIILKGKAYGIYRVSAEKNTQLQRNV